MSKTTPTVGGYTIRSHIANGGIASVYRALNLKTKQLAAIKIIPLGDPNRPEAEKEWKKVMREIRIHETLKHRYVLELLGGEPREEDSGYPAGLYIVLDLASGGDLFDKITPDWGVEEDIAHMYFRQLIDGLEYLGKEGICHRDIKPENCLLDGNGDLKISDFGLASVFKYKGKTRMLTDRCGSPPYAAPELAVSAPYSGEPIDMWSAGILLFTLLVGNTPWDEPTLSAPEFAIFVAGELKNQDPWHRISGSAMEMLVRILEVNPEKRVTITELHTFDWFLQSNPLRASNGQCTNGALVCERLTNTLMRHGYIEAPTREFEEVMAEDSAMDLPSQQASQAQIFSQHGLDPTKTFQASMQLYSRLSQAPTQATNPSLMRFFSTLAVPLLVSHLTKILDKLQVPYEAHPQLKADSKSLYTLVISAKDRRKQTLNVQIMIMESILPGISAAGKKLSIGGSNHGGGGGGMDVDDEDEDEEEEEEEVEEEEVRGFDIEFMKLDADPLELKRLWKEITSYLPGGVIYAT